MDVIRVVDVPGGTSADEAQRLMNVPCVENLYMLVQVLPLADGTTRAFYRLLRKSHHSDSPNRRGVSNLDGKDEVAREIIRDHGKTLSIPALIRKLADNGIKRGKTWVAENRVTLCGKKPAYRTR